MYQQRVEPERNGNQRNGQVREGDPGRPQTVVLPATDGVVVVVLFGEHDLCTAENLQRDVARLIAEGAAVVIDVSQAAFIDSACLHTLLRAQKQALALDRPLVVQTGTDTPARRVLELSGTLGFLNAVESRAEAFNAHEAARLARERAA